jgi:hypothetical protein
MAKQNPPLSAKNLRNYANTELGGVGTASSLDGGGMQLVAGSGDVRRREMGGLE